MVTDDDLTVEAIAADPDAPIPDDAVSFYDVVDRPDALVGDWYMPAPMTSRIVGWRRAVAIALIAVFLAIEAYGLCSTYG